MERQKGLRSRIIIAAIILFHLVGLIGFYLPKTQALFMALVPYHLMLMFCLVMISYGRASMRLTIFFLLIFIVGFICEWIGVHKGWLFGSYHYGVTLGYKLADVPLMIGVNWFLLTFAAGALMQKTRLRKPLLRIVCGAALLTLLDVLIEPIAVRFDYWQWMGGHIPLKNYVCWFLISIIMLWLFELFRFKRLGYAGPVLLAAQIVFFAALNIG